MVIRSRDRGPETNGPPDWLLGDYEPVRTIGSGAFATAYLCRVRGRDECAVVKVTHPDLIQGARAETFRRRFSAEVRSLAAVDHPNLVRIHRAGITSSGLPAIAMDFVEGPTLEHRLSCGPIMSAVDVLSLLGQLGAALRCVHEKGIVHRDVSPQNIVWQRNEDGTPHPILLDFGVAAFMSEDESQNAVGTPRYMAPERRYAAATGMSDMYSLGAVGWWAFTGVQHRPDATLDHVLRGHRNDLVSRVVIAPMLRALVDPDPRRRMSAVDVERQATTALRGTRDESIGLAPRVAVIDANPVTATVVRSFCQRGGADTVRFSSSAAFFGRRCRRPFDLVVLVGDEVSNPVVMRGLGVDIVHLVFGPCEKRRDTSAHILCFPAEQSVLLKRVGRLARRPAQWIRRVDGWLDAWRCVLDSSPEQCNHCLATTGEMGERDAIAGSKEPPTLSRLLAALHEQEEVQAANGMFGELQRSCEYAIHRRVKELANDDL